MIKSDDAQRLSDNSPRFTDKEWKRKHERIGKHIARSDVLDFCWIVRMYDVFVKSLDETTR